MISALNRQDDGTLELTITIPQKQVQETYKRVLAQIATTAEIKGFRKGKAPVKMV